MSRINLLDHGYLELVDCWGSDEAVICAARMSTGKGFLGWEPGPCPRCGGSGHQSQSVPVCPACEGKGKIAGDMKLLRYLWKHGHATPFEMAGLTVEAQAPLFVFREWQRHRTQAISEESHEWEFSFNELSARYTPMPDLNYVPTVERLMAAGGKNKQAGTVPGAASLTEGEASFFRDRLRQHYFHAQVLYESALKSGVPKELARVHLPVGRYSRMRASANLRNWLGFLSLRLDGSAQYEIREYAEALGGLIAGKFPRTWQIYVEGKSQWI